MHIQFRASQVQDRAAADTTVQDGNQAMARVLSFAERLRSGERLLASSASMSPVVAELVGQCGFDWLFVDAEYLPQTGPIIQEMIRAADSANIAAVVRMNSDHEAEIRQTLDMGAAGVIIPLVKTAAQARKIVAAAKYPPLGERGMAGSRAQGYGATTRDYIERANSETAVIVMVEDVQGLSNVEDIAAVEGLDGIFVGTGDLSLSLGCLGEPMHDDMLAAFKRIAAAARANSVALGGFPASREMYDFCYSEGFRFLLTGLDAGLLRTAALNRLKEVSSW